MNHHTITSFSVTLFCYLDCIIHTLDLKISRYKIHEMIDNGKIVTKYKVNIVRTS